MFKTLTAAVLALALALPGTAQAQGMSQNEKAIIGTIAGVAALAVIANQLKKKDDKKAKQVITPPPPDFGRHHNQGGPRDHGRGPDRGKGQHDWGRDHRAQVLDARCLTQVRDRRGDRIEMMERSCLRKANADLRRIPDRCEISIKTNRGTEHGYSAHCLKSQGYRIARR